MWGAVCGVSFCFHNKRAPGQKGEGTWGRGQGASWGWGPRDGRQEGMDSQCLHLWLRICERSRSSRRMKCKGEKRRNCRVCDSPSCSAVKAFLASHQSPDDTGIRIVIAEEAGSEALRALEACSSVDDKRLVVAVGLSFLSPAHPPRALHVSPPPPLSPPLELAPSLSLFPSQPLSPLYLATNSPALLDLCAARML